MLELMFFGVPILFLLLPTTLSSRPFLIGYIVLVGGVLTAIEIQHQWAISRPGYIDGAAGAALGDAIFEAWKYSFIFGIALRLVLQSIWYAFRIRDKSLTNALAVVLATISVLFAFTVTVLVVPSNMQWPWLIDEFMLRFAQEAAPHFIILWIITSLTVVIYPFTKRRVSKILAAYRSTSGCN